VRLARLLEGYAVSWLSGLLRTVRAADRT
jgi:hypothetical protein